MKTKAQWGALVILIAVFSQTCKKSASPVETVETLQCAVNSVAGKQHEIRGKWKLVSYRTVFYNPTTTDYSCNQIIYEFKQGGRLVVSSDVVEPNGYPAGDYSYEFNQQAASGGNPAHYTLRVGEHSEWPATVGSSEMILSQAYLDGPVMRFIRIK